MSFKISLSQIQTARFLQEFISQWEIILHFFHVFQIPLHSSAEHDIYKESDFVFTI